MTDREMAEMGQAGTDGPFDATDQLVLRYAEELTRENRVTDALYAELSARFTRDELVELCFAVALAALVNRVHATFRTDVDETTLAATDEAPVCAIKP